MRSNTTSSIPINVTFFHCKAGEVWASSNDSDDGDKGCLLCTALVKGETGVRVSVTENKKTDRSFERERVSLAVRPCRPVKMSRSNAGGN